MAGEYYNRGRHLYMDYPDGLFAGYVFRSLEEKVLSPSRERNRAREFGAGMGRFSPALIEAFDTVDLVEPAPDYADRLRERFGESDHVRVHAQTAEQFLRERPEDAAGFCFSFHLLHHLREGQRREIFSWAASRGDAVGFVEPNPWNPLIFLQILFHPHMTFAEEREYLKLTRKRLMRELRDCGFTEIRHSYTCLLPPPIADFFLRRGWGWLVRGADSLCAIFPFAASYQMIGASPTGHG